jgi:hypothetical protein
LVASADYRYFGPKLETFLQNRMAYSVPVLLLAFNRPETTRKVMEQIRLAAPQRLYVHCDGARLHQPADREKVAAVHREIREGVGPETELRILFREENWGLQKGVYDALNWFFEQEEYGIILEDDCVPDPSMFQFCETLLIRYKDAPDIMHIGCSNLAEDYTKALPDSYVFSKFSFVWGWATWRRAWQKMSITLDDLDGFERTKSIQNLLDDPMAQAYMSDKFRVTKAGGNNSWAYAWFYSVLKNNGLCIVPSVNLVQNYGIGEEGATNTKARNENAQRRAQAIHFPLNHPERVGVDPALEKIFFYTSQKSRFRLRLWYFLHLIGLR